MLNAASRLSALAPNALLRAVQTLRDDITQRLGKSSATVAEWKDILLLVDPEVQVRPECGTIIVRRGKAALDRLARHYLVPPHDVLPKLSRKSLVHENPVDYGLSDEEWLALCL
ncbi:hypothetical protein [Hymenobacter psychrotolerans]|uniref:Uncharacterized protein n=1 Tax=Hymenobacter psychrotolerans DSM 18569 TaxID=1121959 RepID=A0A1M6Z1C7_9BACT|nr:hypothetical protein [Hymenobacter psychrotolerans]SHL24155.1 hypothetical protein SAMN02746009_02389 [Hymenobacter psychrotolerans DSM 18569]